MLWINTIPFFALLILTGLITGKSLLLKKDGIQIGSGVKKLHPKSILLYTAFSVVLLMWIIELINNSFDLNITILPKILTKILIISIWLKLTGIMFILLSIFVLAIALAHFKYSLRFGLDQNNQGELITEGIFSVSRNPFFLSLHFYFTGVATIFPTWFFIGFSVLAILSIHFFILKEEKFLKEVFKEDYIKYSKKVRRYL